MSSNQKVQLSKRTKTLSVNETLSVLEYAHILRLHYVYISQLAVSDAPQT